MPTVIIILIIAAFLQSTVIPLDLVLIILLSRSFIMVEKDNLYLAFGFGLLVSLMNFTPLGLVSLIYLTEVLLTHLLSKSRLANNTLLLMPWVLLMLTLNSLLQSLILNQSIQLTLNLVTESLLTLPIYYGLKLWEERFVIRKDIKLKIRA